MPASAEALAVDIIQRSRQRTIRQPQWFYRNVLRTEALPWQETGSHAIMDVYRKANGLKTVVNHRGLPRLSIRSCHGTGKTHFLGLNMHLWNFIFPTQIACTAPKEAQLKRRLWPRYRKILRNAIEEYRDNIVVNATDIQCYGDPDWGAVAETASDPDNLAGYHDTPQLFLIDEGAAKRLDPMFPVIEGALTTPGSVSVEIGNPTRTEGEFWAHHNKKGVKELYYKMHIKAEDAPSLISQQWVDTMIAKYGANSPIVKVRVFGEFAAFDDYILIPYEYIVDSLDREDEPDGSIPRLRITADVADGGADSTVITAGLHYEDHLQIIKQKQYFFNPSEAPIAAAKAALEMFNGFGGDPDRGDDLVVDANGVGSGTAGWLMDRRNTGVELNVVQYRGGSSASNPKKWRNRRVQNYIVLYEYFRDDRIRFSPGAVDDEDELSAHLLSIRRRISNERVDDIEPKDKIMQEGLPSPDRADSLQLQCMLATPVSTSGTKHTDSGSGIIVLGEAVGAHEDW